jgi:hypothetical protein
MASQVIDVATIANGLRRFQETHCKRMQLRPARPSPSQVGFIEWYRANVAEVSQLRNLLAVTSHDHNVLNAFKREHGHASSFGPLGAGNVGIASIADLLVSWRAPGKVSRIALRGHSYDAFDIEVYGYHKVPGHEHPLIQISTQEGDFVWLLPLNHAPASPRELFGHMQRTLRRQTPYPNSRDTKLRAPMVDLRATADLSWLLGLQAVGDSQWYVAEADQTVRVRMNHLGASARVDTDIRMERLSWSTGLYTIDRPFAMCFTQNRSQIPLAVAYVDFDSWRMPPGLGFGDGE